MKASGLLKTGLVIALFLGAVCIGPGAAQAQINVFVSILPQACIVERIGGDAVKVNVMVGPGQSPHAYEPTPKQVAALSGADIFFTIGLPFEQRLLRKIESFSTTIAMVDSSNGIALRNAEDHDELLHGQAHTGKDPHVWLAPLLLRKQAATVCLALQKKDPDRSAVYQQNLERLAAELEALHGELARRLAPFAGREFFVFHPALGYFADAYSLKQVPIEMSGKEPGSKSFAELILKAKAAGVKTIFIERQFSPKSAQAVAAQIGAEVVMIDPLAPDCLQNLRDIAAKIENMK